MCGIVGMASATTLLPRDMKFFKQALYCDQLRGADSTGIIRIPKNLNNELEIAKKAYPASDFLNLPIASNILSGVGDIRCLIGHNRWATQGGINHANAHPFQHGNITMVHNGTLRQYHRLPGYNKHAVDSDLLARSIDELGIEESINRITGAYALVWHDASDNSLNFLRNDDRPMALATSVNGKDLYFASENLMLDWILERNKIPTEPTLTLTPHQHLKLDLDGGCFSPEVREIKKGATVIVGRSVTKATKKAEAKKTAELDKKIEKSKGTTIGAMPAIGSRVAAFMTEVTAYNGIPNLGYMVGVTTEAPHVTVEVHNINTSKYEPGDYTFQVCNTQWSKEDHDFVVRGIKLKAIEDREGGAPEEKKPIGKTADQREPTKELPAPESDISKESKTAQVAKTEKASRQLHIVKRTEKQTVTQSIGETIKDLLPSVIKGYTAEGDECTLVLGPNSNFITPEVFETLTKHGCASCSCDLDPNDAEDITWRDTQTPICLDCENEEDAWKEFHTPYDYTTLQ